MNGSELHEREIRAARNQAHFRALNEKVNRAFSSISETSVITCECADVTCLEMLDITADEYAEVRRNPRHFAVLQGHVYPFVETVVATSSTHVVVEKFGEAGKVAEALATPRDHDEGVRRS